MFTPNEIAETAYTLVFPHLDTARKKGFTPTSPMSIACGIGDIGYNAGAIMFAAFGEFGIASLTKATHLLSAKVLDNHIAARRE